MVTDKGFDISGRVMIYSGLVGCGLRHYRNRYRLRFYIHSWNIIDADITSIVAYFGEKKEKKPLEVPSKEKVQKREEKEPLVERLKTFYEKAGIYRTYFKDGYRAFREIIRFDLFSIDIIVF